MDERLRELMDSARESTYQGTPLDTSKVEDPCWAGPCNQGDRGGITFSLLSRYVSDKERFRVLSMEGLRLTRTFNHRISYGSMWHACEEAYARSLHDQTSSRAWKESVEVALSSYARKLKEEYPFDSEQISHWSSICQTQFPYYVSYWLKHPDPLPRRPILSEKVFKVPYKLLSGRTIYLRGRWDGIEVLGVQSANNPPGSMGSGIYVFETKTKGEINEGQILTQIRSGFDLQTMYYMSTLNLYKGDDFAPFEKVYQIRGVFYNVVRRPLSGGKGTIVRHKPSKSNPQGESLKEYYARLGTYIAGEPGSYFMRWKVEILPYEVGRFQDQCLDPILENLCDDYEWWQSCLEHGTDPFDYMTRALAFPHHRQRHYRFPYGVYSPVAEGGVGEVDEYLNTGNRGGLTRVASLFEELKEDSE